MTAQNGADVDLDHDVAYRSANGHSDRVLHAKEDCASLATVDNLIEVDPGHYRPQWQWCKRCSDAESAIDLGRAGSQNQGPKLSTKLKHADSLDEIREGDA